MLYLSFKFVRKFKFCVSPVVKLYPAGHCVGAGHCAGTIFYKYKQTGQTTCVHRPI